MTDFGRIKAPSGGPSAVPRRRGSLPGPVSGSRTDREGKGALFSQQVPPLGVIPLGALSLSCSTCRVVTTVTLAQAVLAAVPSVHLPVIRRRYPSWMRCPACRRRTWVRLALRHR